MNAAAFPLLAAFVVAVALAASLTSVSTRADERAWKRPVENVALSPGDSPGDLVVVWDAHPESPDEYRVKWTPDGESFKARTELDWIAFPTDPGLLITDLTPGETYEVIVRAVFGPRRSDWSEVATGAAAEAVPEPPRIVETPIAETVPPVAEHQLPEPRPDYAADRLYALGIDIHDNFNRYFTFDDSVDVDDDPRDYFSFWLDESTEVNLSLRQLDFDADLFLEDEHGNVLASSENKGTANEDINATLPDEFETYYIRIESLEAGANNYRFKAKVSDPDPATEVTLPEVTGPPVAHVPPPAPPPSITYVGPWIDEPIAGPAENLVAAPQLSGDDHGATWRGATALAVGGSASGSLEQPGDVDWFLVPRVVHVAANFGDPSLNYDGRYRFDVDVSGSGGLGVGDVGLRVFYPDDPVNHENDRFTHVAREEDAVGEVVSFYFYAGWTGRAWAEVYSLSGSTGSYDLSLHEDLSVPADDQEADEWHVVVANGDAVVGRGVPRELAVGGTLTGEIERPLDGDWFSVSLAASTAYTIDLDITGGERITIQGVFDDDGELVAEAENREEGPGAGTGDGEYRDHVEVTPAADATYYVLVGSGSQTGTYEISLSLAAGAPAADDYTIDGTAPGLLRVDGSATGTIERPHDGDGFSALLRSGIRYRVEVKGSATGDGTLADPKIPNVGHPWGYRMKGVSDDDGGTGTNSMVEFKARLTGSHIVRVVGKGGTGTYTVTLEALDDYAAENGRYVGSAVVNGEATGEIEEPGDVDWFRVDLGAGTFRINLKGSGTGDGTLSDPKLHGIYDYDGTLIPGTEDDDGGAGSNSRLMFNSGSQSRYHISVGASGAGTGTYTLAIDDRSDREGVRRSNAGHVSISGPASSAVNTSGDVDWFRAVLNEGTTYRVDVKGSPTGDGTLSDPKLHGIYDYGERLIADTTDDDGGTGSNARKDYTAVSTGDHYVAVGASGNGTGTYLLRVKQVDDYLETVATSGKVGIGGHVDGKIETANDRDWIKVAIPASPMTTTYIFDLVGRGPGLSARALSDPKIYGFYRANGTLLSSSTDDDGGVGSNSRVVLARDSGDGALSFYVSVGASGSGTGGYRLSLARDDYAGDIATEGVRTVGDDSQLAPPTTIERAGDRDWFKTTLELDKPYIVYLTDHGSADPLADPKIWGVYDAHGDRVPGTTDDDDGIGSNARVHFQSGAAGEYFVAAGAAGAETGEYYIEIQQDDFGDDIATNGSVVPDEFFGGVNAEGELELSTDADWFKVSLTADVRLGINILGAASEHGTLTNPRLQGVYDADGAMISGTSKNGGGATSADPLIPQAENVKAFFTPSADGDYFIAVRVDSTSAIDYTGTYGLDVHLIPEGDDDDCADDVDTTCTVTVGGTAEGEIEVAGDVDWFAVDFVSGTDYRIDVEGDDSGGGTLYDTLLNGIYDADGELIAGTTVDSGGGDSVDARLIYTATTTGRHYIAAGAADDLEFVDVGTYTVRVAEYVVPSDDCTVDTATTCSVMVGGSATGDLEVEGDRDWFEVEFVSGNEYRIDLTGVDNAGGTLDDPHLRGIYRSDGTKISGTENDDGIGLGADSRVEYTASTTGTHYIAAGGYDDTEAGTYTLEVTDITN